MEPPIKLSICICTMNRPEELRGCLESAVQCSLPPEEIIVSDDSADPEPNRAVIADFPGVHYQQGPRRGLGPNRNVCIPRTTGTHLLFMDDDARFRPDFFAIARRELAELGEKTILTGHWINHYADGTQVDTYPSNADFWGFQHAPIKDRYRATVVSTAFWPRSLFEQARFDEQLRYGSEELDIALHATALGYNIVLCQEMLMDHYPSPVNRASYSRYINASRLYVMTKAYWQYDRQPLKAIAYAVLAPLHLLGSAVKRRNWGGVVHGFQAIGLASQYLLQSRRRNAF